jgi:hypothetical protein
MEGIKASANTWENHGKTVGKHRTTWENPWVLMARK